MKKKRFPIVAQIFTTILIIINTIYIVPGLILLACSFRYNPLEAELARDYFISLLVYIRLRLMVFHFVFDAVCMILYFSRFLITRKRGMFIFSLVATVCNILINAGCFLLIPIMSAI